MRPLRLYALGAVGFALIATIVSAQFAAVMDVYALVIVPLLLAMLITGNAHNPSALGFYVGFFFLEWFIVGMIVAIVLRAIDRIRRNVAT